MPSIFSSWIYVIPANVSCESFSIQTHFFLHSTFLQSQLFLTLEVPKISETDYLSTKFYRFCQKRKEYLHRKKFEDFIIIMMNTAPSIVSIKSISTEYLLHFAFLIICWRYSKLCCILQYKSQHSFWVTYLVQPTNIVFSSVFFHHFKELFICHLICPLFLCHYIWNDSNVHLFHGCETSNTHIRLFLWSKFHT